LIAYAVQCLHVDLFAVPDLHESHGWASSVLFLFDFRQGLTNFAGMMRTTWPKAVNWRASH